MIHLSYAFFLIHFLQFFYAPHGAPWYTGAVWGNVFVVLVLAPLGWLWSKTKYWPFNAIHERLNSLFKRHDAHREHLEQITKQLDELHAKHDALHARLDRRDGWRSRY